MLRNIVLTLQQFNTAKSTIVYKYKESQNISYLADISDISGGYK